MSTIEAVGEGIVRDMKHLEVVSQNIANINTPGFQSVQSFDVAISEDKTVATQYVTDRSGSIKSSNRGLDWAITGSGYFVIEKGNSLYVSRYGRFHIGEDGLLTHVSGGKLIGESGSIQVTGGAVSVTNSGDVKVAGNVVDRLQIIDVEQLKVSNQSGGLYIFNGAAAAVENRHIKANAINASNVAPAAQTTQMMNLNRHIQSLQKAALAYDQMLNAGINELGRK
jgi:flagellar basal body rod protein FlgG